MTNVTKFDLLSAHYGCISSKCLIALVRHIAYWLHIFKYNSLPYCLPHSPSILMLKAVQNGLLAD